MQVVNNKSFFSAKLFFTVLAVYSHVAVMAEDSIDLDEVSVTATRDIRPTQKVSQNITVVSEEQLEEYNVRNISQALQYVPGVTVESGAGGYSTRLYIRGAGVRAPFGVREIMVMRDGVPVTDPDSFTRFDWIDTQDIEQVEVVRGPGSVYSAGAAGGVLHIISRSVFDPGNNRIKLSYGDFDTKLINARYSGNLTDNDYFALTFTHKDANNDWRPQNEFRSDQLSLKYGHEFTFGSTFEAELAYTDVALDLPARMNQSEFETFKAKGEQGDTVYQWQNTARDSKVLFFNSNYQQTIGDFSFKPRFYLNKWEHWHPVTGIINDSDDNLVVGSDIEFGWSHQLFGNQAKLLFGFTFRNDSTDDAKKYTYGDVEFETVISRGRPSQQIKRTLSDAIGQLAEVSNSDTTLYGIYFLETFEPMKDLLMDLSFRYDKEDLEISEEQFIRYDFGRKRYVNDRKSITIEDNFNLLSARLGISYALTDAINTYLNIGYSDQVPSTSEITSNLSSNQPHRLDVAKSLSYEIGIKGRDRNYYFDAAFYYNPVKDEITQIRLPGQTVFSNAGKVDKKGFEFIGEVALQDNLWLGLNYAYSDYEYDEFTEVVRQGRNLLSADRAGNDIPFISRHAYGLTARYSHPSGFSASLRSRSRSSFWMDNANTQKYEGYDFLTDVTLSYEKGPHTFRFNVYNLLDKHYAAEAKKNTFGSVSYRAGEPRLWMLTYQYNFSD